MRVIGNAHKEERGLVKFAVAVSLVMRRGHDMMRDRRRLSFVKRLYEYLRLHSGLPFRAGQAGQGCACDPVSKKFPKSPRWFFLFSSNLPKSKIQRGKRVCLQEV